MRGNNNKAGQPTPNSLQNAVAEQDRIAQSQDLKSIDDKIYKGNKITINDPNDPYDQDDEFEVRYKLRVLYNNKCCYCETKEYKPDVEHYRPKKRVSGNQKNGHGYYWICYNWTNLLPSCSACNSGNGKWNKFPVLSTRVVNPPLNGGSLDLSECDADSVYMNSEQPALLHPEIDQPENILGLRWNGRLKPLDGSSGRGSETIRVCNLNRGNLLHDRKKIIDDFINDINSVFQLFRNSIITSSNLPQVLNLSALDNIKALNDDTKTYSLVGLYISNNFDDFVDSNFPQLTQVEKQVLKQTF